MLTELHAPPLVTGVAHGLRMADEAGARTLRGDRAVRSLPIGRVRDGMALSTVLPAVARVATRRVLDGFGAVRVPPGAAEVVRRRGSVARVAELLLVVMTAQARFDVQARFAAVFLEVVGAVCVLRRRGVAEVATIGSALLVVAHRAGLHRHAGGLTRLGVGD